MSSKTMTVEALGWKRQRGRGGEGEKEAAELHLPFGSRRKALRSSIDSVLQDVVSRALGITPKGQESPFSNSEQRALPNWKFWAKRLE